MTKMKKFTKVYKWLTLQQKQMMFCKEYNEVGSK